MINIIWAGKLYCYFFVILSAESEALFGQSDCGGQIPEQSQATHSYLKLEEGLLNLNGLLEAELKMKSHKKVEQRPWKIPHNS